MIKILIDKFNNFENITKKILKIGLMFATLVSIISAIILLTYINIYSAPILYYIGLLVFKNSLMFGVDFIVCALIFDTVKRQLI